MNARLGGQLKARIIRIRDDCALFDPGKHLKQFSDQNKATNVGLKIVYGIPLDIMYLNALD